MKIDNIVTDQPMLDYLRHVGIRTTERLLGRAAGIDGRHRLSLRSGIDIGRIMDAVRRADLCRIKGIGPKQAQLLNAAGVATVRELKYRNAAKLRAAMAATNTKQHVVELLPNSKTVATWIEAAKQLRVVISYR